MPPISYARHRFPPAVIQYGARLYLRFTLSYRDAEDLWPSAGLTSPRDGPALGAEIRAGHRPAAPAGPREAQPAEAPRLDVLARRRRDKAAARGLVRELLRKQGFAPTGVAADGPRSYGAAFASNFDGHASF